MNFNICGLDEMLKDEVTKYRFVTALHQRMCWTPRFVDDSFASDTIEL